MSSHSGPLIRTPYLVTSRPFPTDQKELEVALVKSYIDIASAVNERQIGIYESFQVNTGQRWFNTGNPSNRLQAFRKVFTITTLPNTGTTTIATGITFDTNTKFTHISGTVQSSGIATAFTPWVVATPNDAPYLRVNIATGNIEVITTSANWISFSGIIVLEYILNN